VPYLHISSEAPTQSQHFNHLSHHCTPSKPGTIPAITRLVFSNNQICRVSRLRYRYHTSVMPSGIVIPPMSTPSPLVSPEIESMPTKISDQVIKTSSVQPMIKAEWKNRHSGSEFHISKHMFSLAPTPSFLPRADAKAATAARGWEGSACMQSIRDVLPPDTTCSGLEDAAR
jgi:hypothetical protein